MIVQAQVALGVIFDLVQITGNRSINCLTRWEDSMRLLKVQGKGYVTAAPDIVTISFDVEVNVRDYEECLRTLNARADDLRQSMAVAGLAGTKLKTSAFNVQVETQYKGGKHIFAGYSASHRMQIELPVDKDMLNKVLRHVARGHSGAEIKLAFSVRDKDALRKKVLTQAVETAKVNAETLAVAAGVKLGKLVHMDYGWAEVQIYGRDASLVCEAAAMPDFDADIEPEDVRAEDSVTLVYEMRK